MTPLGGYESSQLIGCLREIITLYKVERRAEKYFFAVVLVVLTISSVAAQVVKVTPETYIRAESDRQFNGIVKMAGGVNRLFHFRSPTPLDKQNIVRMNRDTLYSMGIVDTSKGATITVPELPKGRYASAYLVDNDHYVPFVIYKAGTHELPRDTKYLAIGIRLKVFNPKDKSEIALVNKLQDQFIIKSGSNDSLPAFKWDMDSLKAMTVQYAKDSAEYDSYKGMQGPRGKVNEKPGTLQRLQYGGSFLNGMPLT